jgi:ribosome biogenesis protein MAK21
MGKKRTHAETKDGFTKPPPETNRSSVKPDKRDRRKDGEGKARSVLVRANLSRCLWVCVLMRATAI